MKKCPLLFLSVFFLFACSNDMADKPRLELETIFLNNESDPRDLKDILPLRPGDSIRVSLLLDGNGTDLTTFLVKNENESEIESIIRPSNPNEISDEFSDDKMLRYKDGVRRTSVAVKLTVQEAGEEELKLGFYLNSKAPDAAEYHLDLETTMQPREKEEE